MTMVIEIKYKISKGSVTIAEVKNVNGKIYED